MYNRKDHYYKKAKEEGFASRAVYKLEQIQSKFHVIKKSDHVLDLGAAPGGWMQVVSEWVGSQGLVAGIDLLPLKIPLKPNMRFVRGDIKIPPVPSFSKGGDSDIPPFAKGGELDIPPFVKGGELDIPPFAKGGELDIPPFVKGGEGGFKYDVILSDMAPNTSGVAFKDAYLSYELCLMALDVAKKMLKPGGNFVAKIFQGEEVENFKKELQSCFKKVEHYIPPATREGSKELYLVATKFNIQAPSLAKSNCS